MKKLIISSVLIYSSYLFAVPTCNDLGWSDFTKDYQVNSQWNSFRNSHVNLGLNSLKQQFQNKMCPNYLSMYNNKFIKRKSCSLVAPNSSGPQFTADNNHPAIIKIIGCTIKIKKLKATKLNIKKPVDGNVVGNSAPLNKPEH